MENFKIVIISRRDWLSVIKEILTNKFSRLFKILQIWLTDLTMLATKAVLKDWSLERKFYGMRRTITADQNIKAIKQEN